MGVCLSQNQILKCFKRLTVLLPLRRSGSHEFELRGTPKWERNIVWRSTKTTHRRGIFVVRAYAPCHPTRGRRASFAPKILKLVVYLCRDTLRQGLDRSAINLAILSARPAFAEVIRVVQIGRYRTWYRVIRAGECGPTRARVGWHPGSQGCQTKTPTAHSSFAIHRVGKTHNRPRIFSGFRLRNEKSHLHFPNGRNLWDRSLSGCCITSLNLSWRSSG